MERVFENEKVIMKHPKKIKKYDGSLDELARDIADMRYDKVAKLLYCLSNCIHKDSKKDGKAGRKKLAKLLDESIERIANGADWLIDAYDVCKPYMKDK